MKTEGLSLVIQRKPFFGFPRTFSSLFLQGRTGLHLRLRFSRVVLPALIPTLLLAGCSSLLTDPSAREYNISAFLRLDERLVFYSGGDLQLDDQLTAMHAESILDPVVHVFQPPAETRGLITRFIAGVPELDGSATRIVDPQDWSALGRSPWIPVLFIHTTWKMSYRRLPPHLGMNRLQLGVIAKVVPLGQVLSGRATIALRTASWEGKCLFDAYEGNFFHIDEWVADDGFKLRQAITALQEACGQKLAAELSERLGGQSSGK